MTCFSRQIFNPHKLELVRGKDRWKAKPKPTPPQDGTASKKPAAENRNESRNDNVKRAKDKVFEIAYANNFAYFITLTLDEAKISRTNKEEIKRALNVWLQNLVQRSGFLYVFCPEYHADGQAIHFHGLCSGNLNLTDSGTVLCEGYKEPIKATKAARLGLQGRTVYNLDNWKYGFSTVVKLDDQKERTALYITKYIVKDNNKILGRYFYSGGKGLIRQVPTEYRNYPYTEFDGKEHVVLENFLAVKYATL